MKSFSQVCSISVGSTARSCFGRGGRRRVLEQVRNQPLGVREAQRRNVEKAEAHQRLRPRRAGVDSTVAINVTGGTKAAPPVAKLNPSWPADAPQAPLRLK